MQRLFFQFVARKHHHDIASHQSTRDRTIRIPCHSIPRDRHREEKAPEDIFSYLLVVFPSSSPFVFDSLLLFQGRLRQRRWLLLFPVRKIGRRTTTTTTTTTRVLPRVTVVPSVLPPLVKSGHDVDRKVSSHQRSSGGRDTKILNFFPQTVFCI